MEHSTIRFPYSAVDVAFSVAVAIGALAGALWCIQPELFPTAQQAARKSLLKALEDRRQDIPSIAARYRQTCPGDLNGIWIAAEAAAKQGEHEDAIEFYRQLPRDGAGWEFQRELGLGQRYFVLGQLVQAESSLRRAVDLNPFHLEANNRLGHLLQICGRTWESAPYFFAQIQQGKCRGDELLGMAATDRFFRFDERLERMGEIPGSGTLPIRLAAARRAIFENRERDAERILREILARHPQFGEAQGRLGRIIVERGDVSEFHQWRSNLSDEARGHPEVLFVEGLQARRFGLFEGAIHCFLKALQLSPNHLGANLQIAACLDRLNHAEIAREFADRAELMSKLEQHYSVLRGNFDEDLVFKVIELLDEMGRPWEAAGWCYVLNRIDHPPVRARRELNQRVSRINGLPVQNVPGRLPSRHLCSMKFPPPKWPASNLSSDASQIAMNVSPLWEFSDDATRMGIRFQYFEGTEEQNRLTHIFNVMGGGLGAMDYDADGWPDLYLAQANNWRNKWPQPEWTDRLFRNLHGEQFADVTRSAGLNETSFSHGVTISDFDQDGFADVHVGNLGPNTLYRNNGDGTFNDVTLSAGVAGSEWSTSSAFADFNGDGLPDLFVLNYTLLRETAEKECPSSDGEPRACTPDLLKAEYDRFYVNRGDGTFQDVSESAGIRVPDGKGLGIVVWDFESDGRLSAFVANDTTPNFLFLNRRTTPDGIPNFSDEAPVRGVAFDQDGNAQASMGVAVGDANGDGRLDLFISTFFGDSKTLQIGQEGGAFSDLTRPFCLRDPAFWMLGFGCQFADFDGDRWEDLVMTNGHVDQHSSTGSEDRMPPQLFRNLQGRRFEEVPARRLGSFFQGKYLGRGLATFDWNRDGRIDLGISHLHSPFSLITNRTPSRAKPLVIRLAGRTGCREAIGATLIAECRGEKVYRFLAAGDGFLVSNERLIHLAWPDVSQIERLTVRWPGGHDQTWKNVDVGQEILLIEGRELPMTLRVFSLEKF